MADLNVLRTGARVYHQEGEELCKPLSEVEIENALYAIGDDKAPGVDGFNALFFKKAWKILKKDIVIAIQEFFKTGYLAKAINCTLVTLVPNPTLVKDFRPIASCSMI